MEADADARADRAILPLNRDRLGERLQDVARHFRGDRRLADVLQQHDELVAAEPRDDVAGPDAAAQARGGGPQHRVAGLVTERVVDDLEAIEIDEQNGEPAAVAARRFARQAEQLREARAVRQAGQPSWFARYWMHLLGFLARRDVLDDRDVVELAAVAVAFQRDRETGPHDGAVLAHVALLGLERRDRALPQPARRARASCRRRRDGRCP